MKNKLLKANLYRMMKEFDSLIKHIVVRIMLKKVKLKNNIILEIKK